MIGYNIYRNTDLTPLKKIIVAVLLLVGVQPLNAQPQDPLYPLQWHLENMGQDGGTVGEDIRVEAVWDSYRGSTDSYISIVDGSLQHDHPDLKDNISLAHNHDYYPSLAPDPDDDHATAVAGVVAARGYNDIGVRGVAPLAKIYSLNILADTVPDGGALILNSNFLDAMLRHAQATSISNNSWGYTAVFPVERSFINMGYAALETGIRQGYHGKGTVYIWSAGNEHIDRRYIQVNAFTGYYEIIYNYRNSNYGTFLGHHAVVAVCAVNNRGLHNGSSEWGANLWLCAPSRNIDGRGGIVTTDISGGYTTQFSGTSASAPMVSGVVALMRQANPNLSWRDVKLILANSARQNHPEDSDWMPGATKSGAFRDDAEGRYHFNHKYGFGVVDAQKAVELAENWLATPADTTPTIVMDNSTANAPLIFGTLSIQSDINFIEQVTVPIAFAIDRYSDLRILLRSPSGSISHLAIPASQSLSGSFDGEWSFGTSKHLGEDASGAWDIRLSHVRGGEILLRKWGLQLRGYQIKMDASPATGLSDLNVATHPLTLSLSGAQWKQNLQADDFRLKNAPPQLRIAQVMSTSDSQVIQLRFDLIGGFSDNYHFQVEATTATVSSRSQPLASNPIELVSNTSIIVRKDIVVPDGTVGTDYYFRLDDLFSSSKTLSYTSGDVPPGLKIDYPIISGTPKIAGRYRFEITATREDGISKTEFFNFNILPHTISVQLRTLLEGALKHEFFTNVCSRTAQIRTEIASLTRLSSCTIPIYIMESITTMNLSRRNLSSIAAGDFDGLSALQSLSLDDNRLSTLPAGIFDELINLRSLDLKRNELNALPTGVFEQLTKLRNLDLERNRIGALPPGIFNELANLQSLILSNNRITTLATIIFDGLSALQSLSLNANRLSALPVGIFDELINLRSLDLNRNDLNTLPTGVFGQLTKLRDLDLERNRIGALPPGIFNELANLQSLILSNNRITTITTIIFDELSALQSLSLSANRLSTLPVGIFDELTNLQLLNLSNLQGDFSFNTLPANLFDALTSLQFLFLEDNALGRDYCNRLEAELAITNMNLAVSCD